MRIGLMIQIIENQLLVVYLLNAEAQLFGLVKSKKPQPYLQQRRNMQPCHLRVKKPWLRELAREIARADKGENICINCDSTGAIASAKNYVTSQRTTHIDVRHFIGEKIKEKVIGLSYLPTGEMLADIFTKALPHTKHKMLNKHLGLSKIL